MKFNRYLASSVAAAMIGVASVFPVAADGASSNAGGEVAPKTVGIAQPKVEVTKIVKVKENTTWPRTSFNFYVSNGDGNTNFTNADDHYLTGLENGLEVLDENDTIDTNVDVVASTKGTTQNTYTGKATFVVRPDVFKDVTSGIWHYTIRETKGNYDGMWYTSTYYDVYVYKYSDGSFGIVVRDPQNGNSKVGYTDPETETVQGVNFTNDFTGSDVPEPDPENPDDPKPEDYGTHSVTFSKRVTGNQGDKNKGFQFYVTIKQNNYDELVNKSSEVSVENQLKALDEAGKLEKYAYAKVEGDATDKTMVFNDDNLITSGTQMIFSMSDGDTVTITGLSPDDSIEINEIEANEDGYDTYIGAVNQEITENTDKAANGIWARAKGEAKITDDIVKEWLNDKDVESATGVLTTYGPYAALVGIGAVFAGGFFRRKKEN